MERGILNFRTFILMVVFVSQTVYSWFLFIEAFSMDSDEGGDNIIKSIRIAFLSLLLLLGLLFFKKKWILDDKKFFLTWLIVGSPVSFICLITMYLAVAIVAAAI